MSATSKISIVTIISWVLGSGLIAFSINTIYSDYVKQANIILDVNQVSANGSMIDTDITISNSGMEPAKKIVLFLESLRGIIMMPDPVLTGDWYDEEITVEKLKKSILRGERATPYTAYLSSLNNSAWVVTISNLTNHGKVP